MISQGADIHFKVKKNRSPDFYRESGIVTGAGLPCDIC